MRDLFAKLFNNPLSEDARSTLDHVAVETRKSDWRKKALKKAAVRHGKTFKAAPAHLDREVLINGQFVRVAAGAKSPEPEPVVIATVSQIKRTSK